MRKGTLFTFLMAMHNKARDALKKGNDDIIDFFLAHFIPADTASDTYWNVCRMSNSKSVVAHTHMLYVGIAIFNFHLFITANNNNNMRSLYKVVDILFFELLRSQMTFNNFFSSFYESYYKITWISFYFWTQTVTNRLTLNFCTFQFLYTSDKFIGMDGELFNLNLFCFWTFGDS